MYPRKKPPFPPERKKKLFVLGIKQNQSLLFRVNVRGVIKHFPSYLHSEVLTPSFLVIDSSLVTVNIAVTPKKKRCREVVQLVPFIITAGDPLFSPVSFVLLSILRLLL